MDQKKQVKLQNKGGKPENVLKKEHEIFEECRILEESLPDFFRSFFAYLRGNVLPKTRQAYLHDIHFFCQYLIESGYTKAKLPTQISLSDFQSLKAKDINIFIDYCRRYAKETDRAVYIYENSNRSLARKKSSLWSSPPVSLPLLSALKIWAPPLQYPRVSRSP